MVNKCYVVIGGDGKYLSVWGSCEEARNQCNRINRLCDGDRKPAFVKCFEEVE